MGFAERLLLVGTLLLLAACTQQDVSPQQQLGEWVAAFESAVEQRALNTAADLVAPGYSDIRHTDRAAAMRTLFALLRRHRSVHLFTLIDNLSVEPGGDRATISVHVAMTGTVADSPQALLALNADLYRFDLELAREAGQWLLTAGRWQRADLSDLLTLRN